MNEEHMQICAFPSPNLELARWENDGLTLLQKQRKA